MNRIIKFVRIAFVSLTENKTQAFLTMLGIIIGIAAVIMVLSIGRGAEKLILSSVESFGNRSIFVQPGGGEQGGPPSPTAIDKVKYRDYLAMQDLDYLEDVAPILVYSVAITYGSQNQNTRVVGSNEYYLSALNSGVDEGRNISQNDLDLSRRVVLMGYKVADDLFADRDPIGQKIKINGKTFEVIGIMEEQGTRFFQDFDKRIVIPITTMRTQIFGVDYVMSVLANVKEGYPIEEAIDQTRFFIRKRHSIYNPQDDPLKDDFRVVSQVDAAQTFQGIADVLTYSLVVVAAISLLVGGIGIMNIMYVSVTERTREIGLRKAVGATAKDVMLQFLIEAIVITFVAGFIGISTGVGMSFLISLILTEFVDSWEFIITLESVLAAFFVSVSIGMIFGVYPARKASRMDPIEALRLE
ncbi:FtsX-like permease family protein [Candidatus Peregrinibacteria bacterium]|nr:FtsX-like permease family protein [Candidatus Peregrinibacteria bacterium]